VQVISPEVVAKGASDCLAQSVWRIPDGSVDPIVKNYHWGDFTNGLFDAKDAGFEALILTDTGRNITERPGFSVFAFKHGKLFTASHGVLSGITHRTVLEIATELDLQVDIRPVPHTVFLDADDVFISSFAGGHIPIVKVDETVFV
jgi:branched-chain amino acid aminotransferase